MKRPLIQMLLVFSAVALFSACGGGGSGSSNNHQEQAPATPDSDADPVDAGDASEPPSEPDWLIPAEDVVDGGPGPDGIPALDFPVFLPAAEATTMEDDDLVVGVKYLDDVKAYPHHILDWHEIVNDELSPGFDNQKVTLSYCPLTGSALLWKGFDNSLDATFGTSGLLYKSNLVLYDRETNSYWPQMLEQAVHGPEIGKRPEAMQIVETTWKTWNKMYPDTQVLSRETGYSRNYDRYPYGNYRTSESLLFIVRGFDLRLPLKERVLGLQVGDQNKVYQIQGFSDGVEVINDSFNGMDIVVAGSGTDNFAVAYERRLEDGTVLEFTPRNNRLPIVMEDNEGTLWDIFGEARNGPREGEKLVKTDSYIAFWFAWGAFFADPEIHFPLENN